MQAAAWRGGALLVYVTTHAGVSSNAGSSATPDLTCAIRIHDLVLLVAVTIGAEDDLSPVGRPGVHQGLWLAWLVRLVGTVPSAFILQIWKDRSRLLAKRLSFPFFDHRGVMSVELGLVAGSRDRWHRRSSRRCRSHHREDW